MMTVLVANRGEIARRVIRTARRMGLRAVAVYSDADRDLPFVTDADAAVRIGPAPAAQSYLDPARLIAAAQSAGADLIHPGYGFLSERADFADAIRAAGLRFVGPSADVLRRVGDKAEAKAIAEAAGVPVLPGYRGTDQRDEAFLDAAARIGYPVMLKPTAGGGGIGMQIVTEESGMRAALARARRTAQGAFGDERVILERALSAPRHIEIQLLGDVHGSLMTIGERDCSAQRRHQKVFEEAPAPGIGAPLRSRLTDAALAIGERVGYTNAGTCEFIVDATGEFFFLEVNARLQVEHPVTEAAYGLDLVEQQLRIAQGERLDLQLAAPGAAVEVRVYAEDPAAGFLPSTGRLVHVRWPDAVRVDAGYEEGSTVTRHYDPLLAKLIAWGPDRPTALARARACGAFGPAHERFWAEARKRLGDRDGTRALIDVLLLHRTIPADALVAGMQRALTAGSIDAAVIAIEARRAEEPAVATVVPIGEGLSRFDRPAPSIADYDDLLEAQ